MRLAHALAHLRHERKDDQGGHGMADEGRDHEDQARKHHEHGIKTHALDLGGDGAGDGVQQPGAGDGFAETQPAGGEDDDGPEEIIKVFFGEDAGAEEEDDGDDGDDAHVAEDGFELVGDAPEDDGDHGDAADEPLDAGEFVLHRTDGHDGGASAGPEGHQEQDPDQEDGDDADRKGDEEPSAPAWLWAHVLEGDNVLGGGDGRGGAADVGGQGNAENEGFGEGGVGRQIAKEGLGD